MMKQHYRVTLFKFRNWLLLSLLIFNFGYTESTNDGCEHCSNTYCNDCLRCVNTCPNGYLTNNTECLTTTPASISQSSVNTTQATSQSTTSEGNLTTTIFYIICIKCPTANCADCAQDGCLQCAKLNTSCVQNKKGPEDGDNKAPLIGGVVGGVGGGLIGIIVLVLCLIRRKKKRAAIERQQDIESTLPTATVSTHIQKLKLTEDIERTHDRILRYTKDPTEKSELDSLPVAPPPPQFSKENYDHSMNTTRPKEMSTSYTDFPVGIGESGNEVDDIYVNEPTVLEARNQSESVYMNKVFIKGKEEVDELISDSNCPADDEEETQDIYINEETNHGREEGEENLGYKEDNIYMNFKK